MPGVLKGSIGRAANLLALLVVATTPAFGQAWPSHPIKLIVPFPPGGVTDVVGATTPTGKRRVTAGEGFDSVLRSDDCIYPLGRAGFRDQQRVTCS